MNNNGDHHGGGFVNGFLLGVIVGAALVFLFATKKGKQILKTLTENGFEGVSELSDLFSQTEDDEEFEEEYMADQETPLETSAEEEPHEHPRVVHHPVHPSHSPRPLKRLFRGVKRS